MLLNVTLWKHESFVTYSALLCNSLTRVHVGVLAECQKHVGQLI